MQIKQWWMRETSFAAALLASCSKHLGASICLHGCLACFRVCHLPAQLLVPTHVHVHAGKPLMEGCMRSSSASLEPQEWKALRLHGATSSSHLQGEDALSFYLSDSIP